MDCKHCGHGIKKDVFSLGYQHVQTDGIDSNLCYAKIEKSKGVLGYCNCEKPEPAKEEKKEEPKPPKPRRPSLLDPSLNMKPSNIW